MFKDVIELPGLVDFVSIFEGWLKALSVFWNALNTPLYQLIQGNPVIDAIFFFTKPALSLLIHNTPIGDMTLLMLILGSALLIYVIYQFLIWLLNIVT